MDSEEQGVDQREQLLGKRNKRGRTPEEWEQIALRVMLLHSEWAAWVRDNYNWKMHGRAAELRQETVYVMCQLGVVNTCQPSTFIQAVAKTLRRLKREARQQIRENQRDDRHKQR